MAKISVNKKAMEHIRTLEHEQAELEIEVRRLKNGATVVDAGVDVRGGIAAGLTVSRAALGGLAHVTLVQSTYDGLILPTVHVSTDHPNLALFASQYPIPTLDIKGYSAIISGPGKVHTQLPEKVFKRINYRDDAPEAVFILQADTLPDERVAFRIAELCKIKPEDLYLIIAPTNSMVGAVQVAARALEDPLGRIAKVLNFDTNKIRGMVGSCPISPVCPDIWLKPGLTPDDMIRYMTNITFIVQSSEGDNLDYLVKNLTSEALPTHGKSFHEILKSVKYKFEALDSPDYASASVAIMDLRTGKIHQSGKLHPQLIEKFGFSRV